MGSEKEWNVGVAYDFTLKYGLLTRYVWFVESARAPVCLPQSSILSCWILVDSDCGARGQQRTPSARARGRLDLA